MVPANSRNRSRNALAASLLSLLEFAFAADSTYEAMFGSTAVARYIEKTNLLNVHCHSMRDALLIPDIKVAAAAVERSQNPDCLVLIALKARIDGDDSVANSISTDLSELYEDPTEPTYALILYHRLRHEPNPIYGDATALRQRSPDLHDEIYPKIAGKTSASATIYAEPSSTDHPAQAAERKPATSAPSPRAAGVTVLPESPWVIGIFDNGSAGD